MKRAKPSSKKPGKNPKKTIVLDRSKWITGALCDNNDGSRGGLGFCAMGFYMNQIGFGTRVLKEGYSPQGVASMSYPNVNGKAEFAKILADAGAEWLVCPVKDPSGKVTEFINSKAADKIMALNDGISPTRETALKEIFAKHGVKVEFK